MPTFQVAEPERPATRDVYRYSALSTAHRFGRRDMDEVGIVGE